MPTSTIFENVVGNINEEIESDYTKNETKKGLKNLPIPRKSQRSTNE